MITLFLSILQIILLLAGILIFILFFAIAIIRKKKERPFKTYLTLSIVFFIVTLYLWRTDFIGYETTDTKEAILAFENNFGFKPPESVRELKLKDYCMYDACAQWMAFTFDSVVLNKILEHDQGLDTAVKGTPTYYKISTALQQGCANCPDWMELPNSNTPKLFYKKNFLNHASSEYYLWIDTKEKMVYLEVSYFD